MSMPPEDQPWDAHYFTTGISAQAGYYQRNAEVGQCPKLDSIFSKQPHQQDGCVCKNCSNDRVDGRNIFIDDYIEHDIENGQSNCYEKGL